VSYPIIGVYTFSAPFEIPGVDAQVLPAAPMGQEFVPKDEGHGTGEEHQTKDIQRLINEQIRFPEEEYLTIW
jgi:hypothetical protein